MKRIIMFQGDSITDAGRDRSDNHNLSGYSKIVKDVLGDEFEYLNFGESGDTSTQALSRHTAQIQNLKPDILVLLIGINDVWRIVDNVPGNYNNPQILLNNIIKMIKDGKQVNKDMKIIVLEPYLVPGTTTLFERGLDVYQSYMEVILKEVPQYVDKFVLLQDYFLNSYHEGVDLTNDGVHPNELGQKVIAMEVVEGIKSL